MNMHICEKSLPATSRGAGDRLSDRSMCEDETIIVDASFSYRVGYKVRRGRTVYEANLKGLVAVAIRSPRPTSASVAFRLHHGPYGPTHPAPNTTDVLAFGEGLWWPVRLANSGVPDGLDPAISGERLARLIANGGPFLDANVAFLDRRENLDAKVGTWVFDDLERRSAEVQRVAWENLIVWNDQAYVRGGQPVYAQLPLDGTHSRSLLAGLPISRSLPSASQMFRAAGGAHWVRDALACGHFQAADQYETAAAMHAERLCEDVPGWIEVCKPAEVGFRPQELRLDALFHWLHEMMSFDQWFPKDQMKRFNALSVSWSPKLTADRVDLLHDTVAYLEGFNWPSTLRFRQRQVYGALKEFLAEYVPPFEIDAVDLDMLDPAKPPTNLGDG